MTEQDVKNLLSDIRAVYPREFDSFDKGRASRLIKVYLNVFNDTPYSAVSKAFYDYVSHDLSGFAPKIGQLKSLADKYSTAPRYIEKEIDGKIYAVIEDGDLHG